MSGRWYKCESSSAIAVASRVAVPLAAILVGVLNLAQAEAPKLVKPQLVDVFTRGKIGLGIKGGAVKLANVTRQPYSRVVFASDFMLHVNEATNFTPISGEWTHKSLPNPALSANAFSYLGKGTPDQPACSKRSPIPS